MCKLFYLKEDANILTFQHSRPTHKLDHNKPLVQMTYGVIYWRKTYGYFRLSTSKNSYRCFRTRPI